MTLGPQRVPPDSGAATGVQVPEAVATTIPPSATSSWIVAVGLTTFLSSLWFVRWLDMQDVVTAAVICFGATALVNFALDFSIVKVHLRESTGLDWSRWAPSWSRVGIKLLGLVGSIAFIGLLYWLFPEYRDGFYADYWTLLGWIVPWWLILSVPYFYFVDARQREPRDGYYEAGLAVLLQFGKVRRDVLWQHTLGWLVKGFFLALMFSYFTADLRRFIAFEPSSLRGFIAYYNFGFYFAILVDLGIACAGYIFALRLFDTHFRWADPTVLGWTVVLMCYKPLSFFVGRQYLAFSNDPAWIGWLRDQPWLSYAWGTTILVLYAIYTWATVMFGCRFSNLTHRGIITNGPYRWTKHPAYVAKNLAWWMTSVPFVVSTTASDAFRQCALLLLFSGVYWLRARTEEAHLSRDPVYVEYSDWMARHGVFRRLGRRP